MNKNRKVVRKSFDYLHCDDFAAYLQDMAAKGWHFQQWQAGLVFEKGEPEQVTYAVEVFPDGSEYDTRPEVNTLEFAEYCEAAGWKLMDARRKFCVFKRLRADATDILTKEERLENISREVRKDIWQKVGLSAFWVFFQFLNLTGRSFVNYIFANQFLLISALWGLMFLTAVGRAIQFCLWKHRCTRKLRQGEPIRFGTGSRVFWSGWYSWLAVVVFLLLVLNMWINRQYTGAVLTLGIVGGLSLMDYLIARSRPDSVTNQIIQVLGSGAMLFAYLVFLLVVTLGEKPPIDPQAVPLYPEQIGVEAGQVRDVHLDGSESIFGSALRCHLSYEEEYISYDVYKSDYPWVLDRIWEQMMKMQSYQRGSECTQLWDAEAAILGTAGAYLVRWQDGILVFNGAEDQTLTREQCAIICTALDVG